MKLWFGCAHQFYVLNPLSPMQQVGGDPSRPDYMPELCFHVQLTTVILVVGFPYSSSPSCAPPTQVYPIPLCCTFAAQPTSHPVLFLLPCSDRGQRLSSGFWISQVYASKLLFVINHTDSGTRQEKNHTSTVITRGILKDLPPQSPDMEMKQG